MHEHVLEDESGDTVDVVPFCSDSCHRDWCARTGEQYGGWSGCHESPDYNAYCANCGVVCGFGPEACECQTGNVVVNRFQTEDGETCEHGNWIQLPSRMLDYDEYATPDNTDAADVARMESDGAGLYCAGV